MPSHVPKQTNDFILIYEALPGRFMVKVREELAARGIDGSAYDFLDRTMPDDVQDRILNRSTRHWDTAISAKARVLARFTSGSVRILCGPV